ncbi:trypsin-like serine protease [Streptomyces sp. NPDC048111]|uniref:trypsin-like serine protease n=1 Tax=Streptomyces sp. NPDC048111 TaxID=3365500 RepID=UPI0037184CC0
MPSPCARAAGAAAALTAMTAASLVTAAPVDALVGDKATDAAYAATAQLQVGNVRRACSGVLVGPEWVLTAASCFADGTDTVKAGPPKQKTTVTVGRTDLTQPGASVQEAVELVPRADRDVVMVKLAQRIVGVTPLPIATTAPKPGDRIRALGFGRTADAWVPDRLHQTDLTIRTVDATTMQLDGSAHAALCQGDAGGPALRTKPSGGYEVVSVNSRSWQGGCIGTDAKETRTAAANTRLDDVAGWVGQVRLATLVPDVTAVMTTGRFNPNGQGRTDVAAVTKDGNLHAFYARSDGTFEYGRPLWKQDGSWKNVTKIIGGDFNGDGRGDIAAIWPGGSLQLYAGQAGETLAPAKRMWPDGTNWSQMLQLTRFKADSSGRDGLLAVWGGGPKGAIYAYSTAADGVLNGQKRNMWRDNSWQYMQRITAGDFTGSDRDDVVALAGDGRLLRYHGNNSGGLDNAAAMWPDKGWGTMPVILSGDFDGDGNTDMGGLWNNQQRFNFYRGNGQGSITTGTNAWPTIR